jgi:hypothetical protein
VGPIPAHTHELVILESGWDETDHRISIEWERLSYGAKETIRIRSCNIIATVLLGFLVFSQRFSLETRQSFDLMGQRNAEFTEVGIEPL